MCRDSQSGFQLAPLTSLPPGRSHPQQRRDCSRDDHAGARCITRPGARHGRRAPPIRMTSSSRTRPRSAARIERIRTDTPRTNEKQEGRTHRGAVQRRAAPSNDTLVRSPRDPQSGARRASKNIVRVSHRADGWHRRSPSRRHARLAKASSARPNQTRYRNRRGVALVQPTGRSRSRSHRRCQTAESSILRGSSLGNYRSVSSITSIACARHDTQNYFHTVSSIPSGKVARSCAFSQSPPRGNRYGTHANRDTVMHPSGEPRP